MRNLKKKVLAMICGLSIVGNVFGAHLGEVLEVQAADILYSGVSGDLDWSIDSEGCLTITGTGDYVSDYNNPEWLDYSDQITSAKVNVDGITSTEYMFSELEILTNVEFIDCDFSNVTSMESMFSGCTLLKDLDVADWDTSRVEDVRGMFERCTSLDKIDVSQWDVSNIEYAEAMFAYCTSLKDINIANWDVLSWGSPFENMFLGCDSLEYFAYGMSGDLSWGITPEGCLEIKGDGDFEVVDFDELNINDVPEWTKMYLFIKSAKVDVTGITNTENMFSYLYFLEEADLSGMNTENIERLYVMFYECPSLKKIDFSNKTFNKYFEMVAIAAWCDSLTEINISNWNINEVGLINSVAFECRELEKIDMSGWNIENSACVEHFDEYGEKLESVKVSAGVSIEALSPEGYWYDSKGYEYTEVPIVFTEDEELTRSDEELFFVDFEVNGYQISHAAEGFRIVYSIGDINNKVVEAGLVYGLSEYATKEDMTVDSENDYVYSFAATDKGLWDESVSELEKSKTYSMTMLFGECNANFFTADTMVRPYAKLENGSYVYGDVEEYAVYDVADILYTNRMMDNLGAHNYLYTDILSRVKADYELVDYLWSDTIVKPYK